MLAESGQPPGGALPCLGLEPCCIGPLVVLSATTGLRQGEALGLRWDAVDLDAGTLAVRQSLSPHTRQLGPTKTDRSRRTIHLPAVTIGALREQRRRQLEDRLRAGRRWHDDGFVFTTEVGTPMDARDVTRRYHDAREHLGLPNVPWHHLRHFAATALLEAGEDLVRRVADPRPSVRCDHRHLLWARPTVDAAPLR